MDSQCNCTQGENNEYNTKLRIMGKSLAAMKKSFEIFNDESKVFESILTEAETLVGSDNQLQDLILEIWEAIDEGIDAFLSEDFETSSRETEKQETLDASDDKILEFKLILNQLESIEESYLKFEEHCKAVAQLTEQFIEQASTRLGSLEKELQDSLDVLAELLKAFSESLYQMKLDSEGTFKTLTATLQK